MKTIPSPCWNLALTTQDSHLWNIQSDSVPSFPLSSPALKQHQGSCSNFCLKLTRSAESFTMAWTSSISGTPPCWPSCFQGRAMTRTTLVKWKNALQDQHSYQHKLTSLILILKLKTPYNLTLWWYYDKIIWYYFILYYITSLYSIILI